MLSLSGKTEFSYKPFISLLSLYSEVVCLHSFVCSHHFQRMGVMDNVVYICVRKIVETTRATANISFDSKENNECGKERA